jgi:hypothetical protein
LAEVSITAWASRSRKTVLAVALAAVAAGFCWRQLDLEGHFLGNRRDWTDIRDEKVTGASSHPLHHFRWQVPQTSTWGDLSASPGLGLEQELVVESYKCTLRDVRALSYAEVSSLPIAGGTPIVVVLRRGACPQ